MKRHLRLAALAAAALCLFSTGCSEMTRRTVQQTAALEYRFYPVTDRLGAEPSDPMLLDRLSTSYDNMLAVRQEQFRSALMADLTEPLNLMPEDPVLPVSRFCPTAAVLMNSEAPAVNRNPVLVMRQVIAGLGETKVTEGETLRSEEKLPRAANPEGDYLSPARFITECLRKYYRDMSFQIGYSENEDLYYAYIFDACDPICVMSVYFRFGKDNRLEAVGFDSLIYDAYELTLATGGEFVPLKLDGDPAQLPPFRALREMALAMVGAKQTDLGGEATLARRDGSIVPLAVMVQQCRHETERQYYYAGEQRDDARLLAVRMMDWFIWEEREAAGTEPTA